MPVIVEMIDKVLCDVENEQVIEETRRQVKMMMNGMPLNRW
jgi:glycine/serine hydroxymethyltransferase